MCEVCVGGGGGEVYPVLSRVMFTKDLRVC